MPNTYNSYHTVAEQIINYNNNVVQILEQINSLATTTQATLNLTITDSTGNLTTVSVPSFNYLQSQINRLNNNINTLYGLNNNGALLQTAPNSFQRVVTVDLNLEPQDISQISIPTSFVSQRNYIFDTLMDPELFINIDLSGKIDLDTREILYRRYVVGFETDANGVFTELGGSALNSFSSTFLGKNNVVLTDFLTWQATTPGVLQPGDPEFSQETLPLNPSQLQYDGIFSVLYSEIDANNILWYYLDTLNYTEILTKTPRQLAVGDSLIINIDNSNTIYQIVNVSTSSSNFKVQLTAITGNQPIPIGTNTLKFYSNILTDQSVDINIGYNQYCVVFVKAKNTTNNITSKNWSSGIAFWTNSLNLSSADNYNGLSMTQYYNSVVSDYGAALKNLVKKTIPVEQGLTPTAPSLSTSNFQVVQTNLHLTNTQNVTQIKQHAAQVAQLDTQLNQISNAIQSKNKQIQVTRFSSPADKQAAQNDLTALQQKYSSTTSLKTSVNAQILASANTQVSITPEYAVRGFWTIPSPVVPTFSIAGQATTGKPQQIVKFEVQYKRLSKDGSEPPIVNYKLYDTSYRSSSTAAFSNWEEYATTHLKRVYDAATKTFNWILDDQNNPENININQLSIPIKQNETIQIRIRSISEVGFPDTPLYSDWSNTINITFPDSLNTTYKNTQEIVDNAKVQAAKNEVMLSLNNQGLNQLLAQKTTVNNTTYFLNTETILSGFKDSSGNAIGLYEYLKTLTDTITELQGIIQKAQGTLVITVFKNNTQFTVTKNSTLNFTVNCEDYCIPFVGSGVPTGRVYQNNIYVIKDFFLSISNSVENTSLGLLSNINYSANATTDVYNNGVPQVFWVDDQDQLITSDVTGTSKTQIDNQFLWSMNFDSVNQTNVTALSQNIGNSFTSNNSITNVLSNYEQNIGYSEASILGFVGNNKSLMDSSKWTDTSSSVSSQTKFLTSIHPVVKQLTDLQETNSQKIHYLTSINPIDIPINIYFKMNACDNTQTGVNYQYINLNGVTQNIRHTKELKFYLSLQNDTSPFIFTIKFTLNRINNLPSSSSKAPVTGTNIAIASAARF